MPNRYEALTPGSGRARQAARRRLPTGISRQTLFYEPYPFFARSGSGPYVEDVDGRRYLDFVNNYTSLIHGHAHPATVAATAEAAAAGGAPGAPTELELALADELVARFPVLEWLRFTISGSEAVALALRAARAFTGRARVLKFQGGFHGCADEVQVSIGGEPMEPGSFGPGTPTSAGLARVETLVAVYNDPASVDAVFAAHGDEIAAVIVEPFLGNGALIRADDAFLAGLTERARAHGVLLVLDEIQSGRLAYGGAHAAYDVRPDLVTVGKTIGGGLPLAAFGGRRDVMEAFDGVQPRIIQTGTFTAFPLALAAGLATLAEWDRPAIERLNALGGRLREELAALFARRGVAARVNGQGSMFNIAFGERPVESYAALAGTDAAALAALHEALLADGIYLTARGTGCLSTPMDERHLDTLLQAIDRALDATAAR
ncbi:MAG: aminotransferase class III-fold pyridoxal phosphate-dependent enzyme [Actinobacteria bacterium]|nr:aminotransferase class III-fold pyridoxal phosphate-dependent enzyme [Actinomycetota bacterium]